LWTVKINTTKINYIFSNDESTETNRSDKHEQYILSHMTVLGNIKIVSQAVPYLSKYRMRSFFLLHKLEKWRPTLLPLKVHCEAVSPCM